MNKAEGKSRQAARVTSMPTGLRSPDYPESVTRLIDELARLPGIGRRSAERLAFHLLKSSPEQALALSHAIEDVKQRIRHCHICYNLADYSPPNFVDDRGENRETKSGQALCSICAHASAPAPDGLLPHGTRDGSIIMVVEQPKDLIALEQTAIYRGVYHVLMGRLSPMDSVGPGDLTIADLLQRLDHPEKNSGGVRVREVILALNPTLEGDGTALYLQQQLGRRKLKLTRLARGLPAGRDLELANKSILMDAIEGRSTF